MLNKSDTGVFRDDIRCFSDGLFVAIAWRAKRSELKINIIENET